MAAGVTKFESTNKKILVFFRVFGIWQVHSNETTHYVNPLGFTFARLMWITWYIIGTAAGIYVKTLRDENSVHQLNHFTNMAAVLIAFMLVGPVQVHILMRNHQWIPKILNDIKKLENMDLGSGANQEDRIPNIHFDNNHDDANSQASDSCGSKINQKLPQIVSFLYILTFLGAFGMAMWYETDWCDMRDEYKWVVCMFYLVFPVFTTWFCIVLIKHHELMYRPVQNMEDKEFEDDKTIRKIYDYMSQMHIIFEKMNDHIFQFTLGINYAIFVVAGAISMFELLQGLEDKRQTGRLFSDIIYVIPLIICIYHIYRVSKATDELAHHAHGSLRFKLKNHMPKVLMPIPKPDNWSDKPFKKIELLSKDLKIWRPQVFIYGGFKVNYQMCTKILFFVFAYARVFIKISQRVTKEGASGPGSCFANEIMVGLTGPTVEPNSVTNSVVE